METYVEIRDFDEVRAVQNRLLMAYENNLSKHAPAEIVTKTRMVWNSIPTQLSRENKKFVYGLVREGAMSRLNKRILLEETGFLKSLKGH